MKQPRIAATTAADIETLISGQLRNIEWFIGGQRRKNAFLDGMCFGLFTLKMGIGSGAAAGMARAVPRTRSQSHSREGRA